MTVVFRRNRERLTQRLSGATYSLTTPGKKSALAWVLGVLLVGACTAAYAMFIAPSPALESRAEVERLKQEVDRLQHDIQLGELRLQQEVTTREELARQMDAQSQKLRQAEQDLQFFRGQKDKLAAGKTARTQ